MKNGIKLLLLVGVFTLAVSCEKKQMGGKAVLENVQVVNDVDPVCGMSTKEHLKDTLTYESKLYGFCSSNCKEEFKKDPENFVKK